MNHVGDIIELQKQDVRVERCEECNNLMVNIDADQIESGDLSTLKRKGLRVSNPETEDPICLKCDVEKSLSFRDRLSSWFDSDDNDDSSFFSPSSSSSGSSFGGSSSFGGFGGGSFSGGGASRSF